MDVELQEKCESHVLKVHVLRPLNRSPYSTSVILYAPFWKLHDTESHESVLLDSRRDRVDIVLVNVRSTNWIFPLVLPFHAKTCLFSAHSYFIYRRESRRAKKFRLSGLLSNLLHSRIVLRTHLPGTFPGSV